MDDPLVGTRIRELRTERGMSQAALSKALQGIGADISTLAIGRTETGDRVLKFSEGLLIATVLGVSPEMLAGEESDAGTAVRTAYARVLELQNATGSLQGAAADWQRTHEQARSAIACLDFDDTTALTADAAESEKLARDAVKVLGEYLAKCERRSTRLRPGDRRRVANRAGTTEKGKS